MPGNEDLLGRILLAGLRLGTHVIEHGNLRGAPPRVVVGRLLHDALSTALTNPALLEHLGRRMYERETSGAWNTLAISDHMAWARRARTCVEALVEAVGYTVSKTRPAGSTGGAGT